MSGLAACEELRPVNGSVLCSLPATPSDADSRIITAFITASPRAADCTDSLLLLLSQTRNLLPRAPIVVVFDGLHPSLHNVTGSAAASGSIATTRKLKLAGDAPRIRAAYGAKIAAVRRHPAVHGHGSRVIEHSRWLHKGASLWEAMRRCRSPLVFVAEEDVELLHAHRLHAQMLIDLLLCDATVRFVHLYWGHTADAIRYGTPTFDAHPRQPSLLRVHRWSDRPHFAQLELYRRVVFPFFMTGRLHSTVEQEMLARFQHNQTYHRYGQNITQMYRWGLWLYAPRGCMQHERHHTCGLYRHHRNPAYGRRRLRRRLSAAVRGAPGAVGSGGAAVPATSEGAAAAAFRAAPPADAAPTPRQLPTPPRRLAVASRPQGAVCEMPPPPPHCAALSSPRPRIWWYPAPLPPWDGTAPPDADAPSISLFPRSCAARPHPEPALHTSPTPSIHFARPQDTSHAQTPRDAPQTAPPHLNDGARRALSTGLSTRGCALSCVRVRVQPSATGASVGCATASNAVRTQ